MDKVTRWDWQGSWVVLFLLCIFMITLPLGIAYFITHVVQIETQVPDGEALVDFLQKRKGRT